jgi:SAM-dependent methyltransferase
LANAGLREENSAPGESQMTNFQELSIAKNYTDFFAGKSGIEIGGPSWIFRHDIPIYGRLNRLDGVNFAAETIWEGSIEDKKPYRYYADKPGTQHILEASDLSTLNDESYDFLISSNCLEHMANPLKALTEWTRVIRKDGYILLALPKKEDTFDHRRNVTPFDHLVEDFMKNTTEHDLTHLDEIIYLHDLSMDPPAGDLAHFKARSEKNFENRCLHHHVFDADIIQRMFKFVGVSLVREDIALSNYIAIGIK